MPSLYLVRHGQPTVTGVLLGQSDPPLSDAGRLQMTTLHLDVAIVYASPLRRSLESAELLRAPVKILPGLAEIDLGEWDGRSWQEIEASDPALAKRKLADWTGITPPGGERWDHFTDRLDAAIAVVRAGPVPAAVVGHLAVNAWIAHRLSGTTLLSFRQDYGQVNEYELR